MAHNLHYNSTTEKHSFFSVKQKAWHGLGTIVEDYPTSAEALQFAGLDFTVVKRPLFTYDGEGIGRGPDGLRIPDIIVPGYQATVRTDTDTVLGVVGKDYQVVQNTDAFAFFDAIVGNDKNIRYETAGALGKGEKIFITAKLPDYIRVGKDDCIEKYLFLSTSHNGYGSITAAFTPVRIVCANTLNAAMRNLTGTIRLRHTANVQERLKEAHRLMGITNRLSTELEAIFNQWAKIRISDAELKELIGKAMAPGPESLTAFQVGLSEETTTNFKNTVDTVFEYAMTSPSQQDDTTRGTLFGAYNAVTGYFQNMKSYRSDEQKLKSILNGSAQRRAQNAFDLCMQIGRN